MICIICVICVTKDLFAREEWKRKLYVHVRCRCLLALSKACYPTWRRNMRWYYCRRQDRRWMRRGNNTEYELSRYRWRDISHPSKIFYRYVDWYGCSWRRNLTWYTRWHQRRDCYVWRQHGWHVYRYEYIPSQDWYGPHQQDWRGASSCWRMR